MPTRKKPRPYNPRRETTMVDLLENQAERGFGRRTWVRIERDLVVGSSIADLVLFSAGRKTLPFSAPLSVSESVLLSAVRRRGTLQIEEISKAYRSSVETALRRLVARGYLRVSKDHAATAVRHWWSGSAVVAVEAKLVRWRDALEQARVYRSYADVSYVALPEAHLAAALRSADQFRAAGVGLISVTRDGLKHLVPAAQATEHDWRREFACSRLAAASA